MGALRARSQDQVDKIARFRKMAEEQLNVINAGLTEGMKVCLVVWKPGFPETEMSLVQDGADLQGAIEVLERSKVREPE